MNFCLVSVSKVELWNFRIPPSQYDFVDELHENPLTP